MLNILSLTCHEFSQKEAGSCHLKSFQLTVWVTAIDCLLALDKYGVTSCTCYRLATLQPGKGGTPYVGWYIMLGYTFFFFFFFLICIFFWEMDTFFQTKFCIFSSRWISILKKISAFVMQDGTHLQENFCILFHQVGAINA